MYVRSTGSTAFKSDAGWVTGKKTWVNNYYYVDRDIKQIKTLKVVSTYKDADLKTKVGTAKPGVYTVAKVVKRGNGYWSFKLKSGLYISIRKDLTKKLK
ncbi:DUF5776 domain-containing protein [Levilactobacillus sp. HBUAS70063]|uniref:DUF5776 domain-containing protein n=1 Tax=Levilactobacillus sp. HBUAS70063 TaxID=3109359 RepID=UPI003132F6CC